MTSFPYNNFSTGNPLDPNLPESDIFLPTTSEGEIPDDKFWEEGNFSYSGKVHPQSVKANTGVQWEGYYIPRKTGTTEFSVFSTGFYTFDFATISAGYETEDIDLGDDASAFFVGLTKEVGPGTAEIGYASTDMADTFTIGAPAETGYLYEASYAYPVNDGMTITPGVFIVEDTTDDTGVAVKASFSF